MTAPTPGPWHARPPQGRARFRGLFDAEGSCLAEFLGPKSEANIARVVRAVAAHDDLVEALTRARVYVESCADDCLPNQAALVLTLLDAALKKATAP